MNPHPPVLFLDVDGVLNTRPGSLDSDKLALVHQIINDTGCVVCLSSSWRLVYHQFERISREIPVWQTTPIIVSSESIDWTAGEHRRREIFSFLSTRRDITRLAILDDLTSGWGSLRPVVVVCDESRGLGPEEQKKVVSLLSTSNLTTLRQHV